MKTYVVVSLMLALRETAPIEAFSGTGLSAYSIVTKPKIHHCRQSRIHQATENKVENESITLDDESLDEATLAAIKAGEPSTWMVLQRVRFLGIQNVCVTNRTILTLS